jgi:hypothetical protein
MRDCPNQTDLRRFFLGQLAVEERSPIEDHVRICPLCVHALEGIRPNDTMVDALRGGMPSVEESQRQAVQQLVHRLQGLGSVSADGDQGPAGAG